MGKKIFKGEWELIVNKNKESRIYLEVFFMKTEENKRYIFEPESSHVWDFSSYGEWEYFNSLFCIYKSSPIGVQEL